MTNSAEQWYTSYRGDVYRLAYMICGNRAMSEDITQDVFLSALQNPPAIRGSDNGNSLRAWLLAVARNKTLNALKREKRAVPLDDNLPCPDTPGDLVFLDMLNPLTARQREIVIFHILYGMSHNQTAKILKMTHAAVRKQYERALAVLRTEN